MRNNEIIYIFLLAAVSLSIRPLDLDTYNCNIESLDIASFRPVQSLQEDVHERIVEFLGDLQQNNIDAVSAAQELDGLYTEVSGKLEASSADVIRSEDRDYLLQMIDQIDNLIAELEGQDSSRVVELRESCSNLKNLFS